MMVFQTSLNMMTALGFGVPGQDPKQKFCHFSQYDVTETRKLITMNCKQRKKKKNKNLCQSYKVKTMMATT